jgi:hypothetical protein
MAVRVLEEGLVQAAQVAMSTGNPKFADDWLNRARCWFPHNATRII